MDAIRAKQTLKNAVYRAIGEAGSRVTGPVPDGTLRVLMYHKVDDVPGNPGAVSTDAFAEQMALLSDLDCSVVDLDAVVAHYRRGEPLPPRAVLITFDDGYCDVLERALPVLRRHAYPAVVFVPLGFVGGSRPLPHDRRSATRGVVNRTLDWDELRELDRAGVSVESHGVSHRALSELDIGDAADEVVLTKLRLERELGREVRAFAYAKGSELHVRPVHVSLVRQAGYDLAFTSVSGSNRSGADRFRLRRYNVEPYSARTFELVLRGACDLIGVKDTVPGTYARRALNAALGTSTP